MSLVELTAVFERQLVQCRVSSGERVVAVTDAIRDSHYGPACVGAAVALGADAYQVTLPTTTSSSEDTLNAIFGPADLIVYSTSQALHYSNAMAAALAKGKRALMAVVPQHVLRRRLADPVLTRRVKAGARILHAAQTVQIRSEAGTELSMSVSGRPGVASYGAADDPGHLDFWGAGCFQVAVVEGSLEGRLVLDVGDQVFHFGRYVDRPVAIEFRDGRAAKFSGGVEAKLIREHLAAAGESNAFMAGHIACGADRNARWTAETTQFPVGGGGGADAEAYYGSVQVEIGSNDDVMFQGKNRSSVHLGLSCLNAQLSVDGAPLLENGEYAPEALR